MAKTYLFHTSSIRQKYESILAHEIAEPSQLLLTRGLLNLPSLLWNAFQGFVARFILKGTAVTYN